MLVSQGNKVPDTSSALILWPAWQNGYLGKFYNDSQAFCTNCNYTVLVSSKSKGYINLGVSVVGKFADLNTYPDNTVYDNVLGGTL